MTAAGYAFRNAVRRLPPVSGRSGEYLCFAVLATGKRFSVSRSLGRNSRSQCVSLFANCPGWLTTAGWGIEVQSIGQAVA